MWAYILWILDNVSMITSSDPYSPSKIIIIWTVLIPALQCHKTHGEILCQPPFSLHIQTVAFQFHEKLSGLSLFGLCACKNTCAHSSNSFSRGSSHLSVNTHTAKLVFLLLVLCLCLMIPTFGPHRHAVVCRTFLLVAAAPFPCFLTETVMNNGSWPSIQWINTRSYSHIRGAGVERWTHDQRVSGLSPGRNSGQIFFSKVNFLCRLLFLCPFNPRVTAEAC